MPTQPLPKIAAVIVALIVAVGGFHYVPQLITAIDGVVSQPSKDFNASVVQLNAQLAASNSSVLAIRSAAAEAYRRAGQAWFGRATDWKCQVVGIVYNDVNPNVAQAAPRLAYKEDVDSLLKPCADEVFTVATIEWNAFINFTAETQGSQDRLQIIRRVVAQGTKPEQVRWAYLGEIDAKGVYSAESIQEAQAKKGDTLTAAGAGEDGIILRASMPRQSRCVTKSGVGDVVGFLPHGSTFDVLDIKRLPECSLNEKVYFVFASVRVRSLQPMEPVLASATGRSFRFLARTSRIRGLVAAADPAPVCAPYRQHNSLHGADQLWILAGEKPDTSGDAFIAGTSRLNTACIPRDGQIVRATQDLKVFVGKDPHWPGVRPQGGVVASGTEIRVVGDVAGYPFDATADPSFCNKNPEPQKSYASIPHGHRKLYCVYIPITPA